MLQPRVRHALPLALLTVTSIFAVLFLAAPAVAAELRGPARVIDGNTLVVAGARLRLFGSDAPDPGQSCLFHERAFFCGNIARTALMDLVAGAELRCRFRGGGGDGRRPATCTAGRADVAANMVHTGWAVAKAGEMPAYARIEARAKAARRGLWRGQFMRPATWRRQAGGRESFCLRGRLLDAEADEGAACPVLRTRDGVRYGLSRSAVRGRPPGAELCVCGGLVEASFCMQGRALAVTRVLAPPACP